MAQRRNTTKQRAGQERPLPDLPYPALSEALVAWYQHQQRELPWREARDPYAIWISEIMLQQTRVAAVIPYYERFLARFPTVESLAEAPLDDVLAQWSGLGYYRRARHLHEAAQDIVARFDGQLPADHKALLSIKGIGRYTAGAIASIAFDLPYPAVDGNVYRILARLCCLDDPVHSPALHKLCERIAGELVQAVPPADLTQGLMELGALICTPKSPACLLCPIRDHCQAYHTGQTDAYPVPKRKTKVRDVAVQWAVVRRDDKVLLVQRPDDGLFAGLWELPGRYHDAPSTAAHDPTVLQTLHEQLQSWGLEVTLYPEHERYQHTLSHRRLHIRVFVSESVQGRLTLPRPSFRWVAPHEIPDQALSSITRRILQDLVANPTDG